MYSNQVSRQLPTLTWCSAGFITGCVLGFAQTASAQTLPVGAVSVAAGLDHTCAINRCGQALCWGRDDFGQATPNVATRFTQLTAGLWHTCGIRADNGRTECWGRAGLLTQPPPTEFVAIDAGSLHTCGLRRDGGVECWGIDWNGSVFGAPGPIPGVGTVDVAGGDNQTCTLYNDVPFIECDGGGPLGQPKPLSSPFVNLAYGFPEQISVGQGFACFRVGENLSCFGDNTYGQASGLGADPRAPSSDVAYFADGAFSFGIIDYIDVSAGVDYACGIAKTGPGVGDVRCWGKGHNGGNKPRLPSGSFSQVSSGRHHACALDDKYGVACWTRRSDTSEYLYSPELVPSLRCHFNAFDEDDKPEAERYQDPGRTIRAFGD